MQKRTRADIEATYEAGREALRRHYRTNFLDFVRDLICFTEPQNLLLEHVHGPLCRLLQNAYWGLLPLKVPERSVHRHLINIPRECFKTTICTIAYPIWILLQDQPDHLNPTGWHPPKSFNGKRGYNQRVLICEETDDFATRYMNAITQHLHGNEELHRVFGDDIFWAKRLHGRWSAWEFDVPWRDDLVPKEANVTSSSLRSSIAGGHYDVALWDDIFTDKTVDQEGGIERTIQFYRNYMPIAHKPSLLFLIGTRYDDGDLYGWVQDQEKEKWHIYIERAIRSDEEVGAGERRYFFEEKLDKPTLQDLQETMGYEDFSKQYLNEPVDPDTKPFRAEWFESRMFKLPREPRLTEFLKDKTVFTLCDPALAESSAKYKRHCNAVVLTAAVDHTGDIYVLEYTARRHEEPDELIEDLFRQSRTWGALWTGIETVAFSAAYKYNIRRRSEETGEWLNMIELKPRGRKKERRILGLRPLARNGKIRIQRSHTELLHEFSRFPRGRSKDLIDTLAYLLDVAFVPRSPETKKTPEMKPAEDGQTSVVFKMRMERMGFSMPADGVLTSSRDLDWYDG